MSLETLETKIGDLRSKAASLCDSYAQTHAEVTADPHLSDAGKQDYLAPLHEDLTAQIRALHAEEKNLVKTKRETLERSLFGISTITASNPAQIVSYRDAQDRASRLTDRDDAKQAYTAAIRSDDTTLASAILAKALELGWRSIRDDYLTRNPSARRDLDDLEQISHHEENSFATLTHYIVPPFTLETAPSIPTISPGQIREWSTNGALGSGQR